MAKILMPKATAVWLLENTSLTFSQISNFCELHILEIESMANGEVVGKMQGINPINNKILTADEIKKCEKNSKLKLKLNKSELPKPKKINFEEFIKKKTNNKGVDFILDIVGGNYVQKNINILKRNGTLINIGWLTGSIVNVNLLMIMLKRLVITGSTLRIGSLEEKEKIAKDLKKNIWPLIEKKKIKPILCKTFPLNKVKDAHIYMDKGLHFGKIALII